MKCETCAGDLKVTTERHHYVESGLPNVYLEGIVIRRCPTCDEEDVVIPAIESLHKTIANALIRKPHRLTGPEVRFLRKSLGWSGEMFAKRMGVTSSQVSRWENEREPIGSVADRLLRMLVVIGGPVADYSSELLETVDSEVSPASELRVRRVSNQWRADRAA
jgi:putative transcriptional regulator